MFIVCFVCLHNSLVWAFSSHEGTKACASIVHITGYANRGSWLMFLCFGQKTVKQKVYNKIQCHFNYVCSGPHCEHCTQKAQLRSSIVAGLLPFLQGEFTWHPTRQSGNQYASWSLYFVFSLQIMSCYISYVCSDIFAARNLFSLGVFSKAHGDGFWATCSIYTGIA